MGSTMIDREARDRLAELLERMLRGELDGDHFGEDAEHGRFVQSDDRGVAMVFRAFDEGRNEYGIWCEDLIVSRSNLDRLLCKVRRAVCFLRTELDYEWPELHFHESTDMSVAFIGVAIVATAVTALSGLRSDAVWVGVFIFGMVATVVYRVFLSWYGSKGFKGEVLRQRLSGRELEAWPFLDRSDFPPGIEGLIHPSDDPLETS